jgi:uncharacterized membrane protein HdeD (DUF308 family)
MNEYENLRKHAGWFVALGVGLILLGIIAVGDVMATTILSVILFGWLLVVGGIVQTVHAFWVRHWSGLLLQLAIGILNVVVGLMIVANPASSVAALTLLIASFFVVGGLFRIVMAASEHLPGRGWAILSGVINVLLGVFIWAHWPVSAFWVIGLFIGIDLIFTGWWFISLGMTSRRVIAAAT